MASECNAIDGSAVRLKDDGDRLRVPLYQGDWDDLLQSFSKPFVWFGLIGLSILVLLALTSNNWSVRKLGERDGSCFIG